MSGTIQNLGISILSCGEHQRLVKTIESHKNNGLYDIVPDHSIFFNEYYESDVELMKNYPSFKCSGNSINSKIGWCMVMSVLNGGDSEYVLFIENDFELIAARSETYMQLYMGIENIENNNVDIIKYRYVLDYHTTCNETNNWFRDDCIKGCPQTSRYVGFTADPNFGPQHPDICELIGEDHGTELWRMSSEDAGWSNNPFLCKREWFVNLINLVDYGVDKYNSLEEYTHTQDFEQQIVANENYKDFNYSVGVMLPGLFNHQIKE